MPRLSKKKSALQYCGRQGNRYFCGCWRHYFEPCCGRYFDQFWPHCQGSSKLQKIGQKKKRKEKANFVRVECKRILDAIWFYLRGEPYNEKAFLDSLKMVDDFIADHCTEMAAKIAVKYDERFTAV